MDNAKKMPNKKVYDIREIMMWAVKNYRAGFKYAVIDGKMYAAKEVENAISKAGEERERKKAAEK